MLIYFIMKWLNWVGHKMMFYCIPIIHKKSLETSAMHSLEDY